MATIEELRDAEKLLGGQVRLCGATGKKGKMSLAIDNILAALPALLGMAEAGHVLRDASASYAPQVGADRAAVLRFDQAAAALAALPGMEKSHAGD